MRPVRSTLVLPFLLAACAGGSAPIVQPAPEPLSVPGFDTRDYPGRDVMEVWRERSPYRWVGYYLEAPCRPSSSWMGTRAELEELGWGIAVLYLGEQDWRAVDDPPQGSGADPDAPRCTASNLTTSKGRADAAHADSIARAEGFSSGTALYLDVERVDSVSAELRDYVRAWVQGVRDAGRYVPSLYAHERNAAELFGIFTTEAGALGPRLWLAAPGEFALDRVPSESGFAAATIWQGALDVRRTWGGETLTIDENVATRAQP